MEDALTFNDIVVELDDLLDKEIKRCENEIPYIQSHGNNITQIREIVGQKDAYSCIKKRIEELKSENEFLNTFNKYIDFLCKDNKNWGYDLNESIYIYHGKIEVQFKTDYEDMEKGYPATRWEPAEPPYLIPYAETNEFVETIEKCLTILNKEKKKVQLSCEDIFAEYEGNNHYIDYRTTNSIEIDYSKIPDAIKCLNDAMKEEKTKKKEADFER